MTIVPVMRPRTPSADAVLARLRQMDAAGWYSNFGPLEQDLRARLASRLNVAADQVATATNATLAIAGAVRVLGGECWAAPTFTFAATPAAILLGGAELVLGDIDSESWVLDPTTVVADGLIPVAPFGTPPDIAGWRGRGRVVHDAAASLGEPNDLSILPPGQAVIYSVHATKVLGSGEGGIAVFGSTDDAARFRSWTNFGFSGTREAQFPGINAKMSEIQAAYVHAALDGWDAERDDWAAARRTVRAVMAHAGLDLFPASLEGINPYAIVLLPDGMALDVMERQLYAAGIETRRWWGNGCHRMAAYRHLDDGSFPEAERIAAKSLGLPMFRGLDEAHADALISALESVLQESRYAEPDAT